MLAPSGLYQTCSSEAVSPPQPEPRVYISRCRGRAQRGAARAPPPPWLTAGAVPLVCPAGRAGQAGAVEVAVGAAVGGALERDGEAAGGGQRRRQRHEQRGSGGPTAPRRHSHRAPRPPAPIGQSRAVRRAPGARRRSTRSVRCAGRGRGHKPEFIHLIHREFCSSCARSGARNGRTLGPVCTFRYLVSRTSAS